MKRFCNSQPAALGQSWLFAVRPRQGWRWKRKAAVMTVFKAGNVAFLAAPASSVWRAWLCCPAF
ncbi:hypothetical protein P9851_06295 [Geobacillus stearothermophilus]|uniref:hypothetical protein n=1 Tax=Geobacillus stearothermophilus TaxID=1422 RepID=UPI0005062907|nr:hypothetical protein [Geobacillus stearothermophilus]KFL15529.1 hypothetical protein ET31_11795 [Geobacillus stearothermophilus]KFX36534.1 hypothetical protein GT94_02020 [Geobacillus stearothermophilus]MDF9296995.1 hypothetical protein [Geobacillus stearothermophilus]MED3773417.1 hypothetical protein [Geobacillus stearothermophilus]MED4979812.1 hypothetical protein [Geobacillus stearothermophilus]